MINANDHSATDVDDNTVINTDDHSITVADDNTVSNADGHSVTDAVDKFHVEPHEMEKWKFVQMV